MHEINNRNECIIHAVLFYFYLNLCIDLNRNRIKNHSYALICVQYINLLNLIS